MLISNDETIFQQTILLNNINFWAHFTGSWSSMDALDDSDLCRRKSNYWKWIALEDISVKNSTFILIFLSDIKKKKSNFDTPNDIGNLIFPN